MNTGGHGTQARHGRCAFSTHSELTSAMQQLLQLSGVDASSHVTRVRDLDLHHLELGSGPPLILIHGASGGAANWYRLMPELARHHRVLALDLPGFGFSSAMEPLTPLGERAADVVNGWIAQHVNEPVALVGTSFGGLIALRLAQRQSTQVRRVALINSVGLGRELPLILRLATRPPWARMTLRPSRRGTQWQFHQLMVADAARMPKQHVAALLEYLWQSASAADPVRTTQAFSLFTSWLGQREVLSEDELRSFSVPLLIAWGEKDRFLPLLHGQRAAALVPGARFRIIPRAGHSPNWEAPEDVLECLSEFLRAT